MVSRDAFEEYDFARFYDWQYAGNKADVPFYAALAEQCGSPILEVACGTGRITIPLARRGFRMVGIDLSEHMLEYAYISLGSEPDHVRDRITLAKADMRSFDLDEAFSGVFIPNASVFHLPDQESLSECFSCLYRHTLPGGMVVIDVVSPTLMSGQEVGVERMTKECVNPRTGLITREFNKKLNIDQAIQTVKVLHTYVECIGDTERHFVFEQSYRWLERNECVDLLRMVGFADICVMGDHDRSPYDDDSPRLIAIGRRGE